MLMFVFYLMKNPLFNILNYKYHLLDEVISDSYIRRILDASKFLPDAKLKTIRFR